MQTEPTRLKVSCRNNDSKFAPLSWCHGVTVSWCHGSVGGVVTPGARHGRLAREFRSTISRHGNHAATGCEPRTVGGHHPVDVRAVSRAGNNHRSTDHDYLVTIGKKMRCLRPVSVGPGEE